MVDVPSQKEGVGRVNGASSEISAAPFYTSESLICNLILIACGLMVLEVLARVYKKKNELLTERGTPFAQL